MQAIGLVAQFHYLSAGTNVNHLDVGDDFVQQFIGHFVKRCVLDNVILNVQQFGLHAISS
jgi:hypothetical protein